MKPRKEEKASRKRRQNKPRRVPIALDGAARKGATSNGASGDRPIEKRSLVVGMGASAGGLEAFQSFFSAMPPDSGLAFVLVQHFDPRHASMMAELLGKVTLMPVSQAV